MLETIPAPPELVALMQKDGFKETDIKTPNAADTTPIGEETEKGGTPCGRANGMKPREENPASHRCLSIPTSSSHSSRRSSSHAVPCGTNQDTEEKVRETLGGGVMEHTTEEGDGSGTSPLPSNASCTPTTPATTTTTSSSSAASLLFSSSNGPFQWVGGTLLPTHDDVPVFTASGRATLVRNALVGHYLHPNHNETEEEEEKSRARPPPPTFPSFSSSMPSAWIRDLLITYQRVVYAVRAAPFPANAKGSGKDAPPQVRKTPKPIALVHQRGEGRGNRKRKEDDDHVRTPPSAGIVSPPPPPSSSSFGPASWEFSWKRYRSSFFQSLLRPCRTVDSFSSPSISSNNRNTGVCEEEDGFDEEERERCHATCRHLWEHMRKPMMMATNTTTTTSLSPSSSSSSSLFIEVSTPGTPSVEKEQKEEDGTPAAAIIIASSSLNAPEEEEEKEATENAIEKGELAEGSATEEEKGKEKDEYSTNEVKEDQKEREHHHTGEIVEEREKSVEHVDGAVPEERMSRTTTTTTTITSNSTTTRDHPVPPEMDHVILSSACSFDCGATEEEPMTASPSSLSFSAWPFTFSNLLMRDVLYFYGIQSVDLYLGIHLDAEEAPHDHEKQKEATGIPIIPPPTTIHHQRSRGGKRRRGVEPFSSHENTEHTKREEEKEEEKDMKKTLKKKPSVSGASHSIHQGDPSRKRVWSTTVSTTASPPLWTRRAVQPLTVLSITWCTSTWSSFSTENHHKEERNHTQNNNIEEAKGNDIVSSCLYSTLPSPPLVPAAVLEFIFSRGVLPLWRCTPYWQWLRVPPPPPVLSTRWRGAGERGDERGLPHVRDTSSSSLLFLCDASTAEGSSSHKKKQKTETERKPPGEEKEEEDRGGGSLRVWLDLVPESFPWYEGLSCPPHTTPEEMETADESKEGETKKKQQQQDETSSWVFLLPRSPGTAGSSSSCCGGDGDGGAPPEKVEEEKRRSTPSSSHEWGGPVACSLPIAYSTWQTVLSSVFFSPVSFVIGTRSSSFSGTGAEDFLPCASISASFPFSVNVLHLLPLPPFPFSSSGNKERWWPWMVYFQWRRSTRRSTRRALTRKTKEAVGPGEEERSKVEEDFMLLPSAEQDERTEKTPLASEAEEVEDGIHHTPQKRICEMKEENAEPKEEKVPAIFPIEVLKSPSSPYPTPMAFVPSSFSSSSSCRISNEARAGGAVFPMYWSPCVSRQAPPSPPHVLPPTTTTTTTAEVSPSTISTLTTSTTPPTSIGSPLTSFPLSTLALAMHWDHVDATSTEKSQQKKGEKDNEMKEEEEENAAQKHAAISLARSASLARERDPSVVSSPFASCFAFPPPPPPPPLLSSTFLFSSAPGSTSFFTTFLRQYFPLPFCAPHAVHHRIRFRTFHEPTRPSPLLLPLLSTTSTATLPSSGSIRSRLRTNEESYTPSPADRRSRRKKKSEAELLPEEQKDEAIEWEPFTHVHSSRETFSLPGTTTMDSYSTSSSCSLGTSTIEHQETSFSSSSSFPLYFAPSFPPLPPPSTTPHRSLLLVYLPRGAGRRCYHHHCSFHGSLQKEKEKEEVVDDGASLRWLLALWSSPPSQLYCTVSSPSSCTLFSSSSLFSSVGIASESSWSSSSAATSVPQLEEEKDNREEKKNITTTQKRNEKEKGKTLSKLILHPQQGTMQEIRRKKRKPGSPENEEKEKETEEKKEEKMEEKQHISCEVQVGPRIPATERLILVLTEDADDVPETLLYWCRKPFVEHHLLLPILVMGLSEMMETEQIAEKEGIEKEKQKMERNVKDQGEEHTHLHKEEIQKKSHHSNRRRKRGATTDEDDVPLATHLKPEEKPPPKKQRRRRSSSPVPVTSLRDGTQKPPLEGCSSTWTSSSGGLGTAGSFPCPPTTMDSTASSSTSSVSFRALYHSLETVFRRFHIQLEESYAVMIPAPLTTTSTSSIKPSSLSTPPPLSSSLEAPSVEGMVVGKKEEKKKNRKEKSSTVKTENETEASLEKKKKGRGAPLKNLSHSIPKEEEEKKSSRAGRQHSVPEKPKGKGKRSSVPPIPPFPQQQCHEAIPVPPCSSSNSLSSSIVRDVLREFFGSEISSIETSCAGHPVTPIATPPVLLPEASPLADLFLCETAKLEEHVEHVKNDVAKPQRHTRNGKETVTQRAASPASPSSSLTSQQKRKQKTTAPMQGSVTKQKEEVPTSQEVHLFDDVVACGDVIKRFNQRLTNLVEICLPLPSPLPTTPTGTPPPPPPLPPRRRRSTTSGPSGPHPRPNEPSSSTVSPIAMAAEPVKRRGGKRSTKENTDVHAAAAATPPPPPPRQRRPRRSSKLETEHSKREGKEDTYQLRDQQKKPTTPTLPSPSSSFFPVVVDYSSWLRRSLQEALGTHFPYHQFQWCLRGEAPYGPDVPAPSSAGGFTNSEALMDSSQEERRASPRASVVMSGPPPPPPPPSLTSSFSSPTTFVPLSVPLKDSTYCPDSTSGDHGVVAVAAAAAAASTTTTRRTPSCCPVAAQRAYLFSLLASWLPLAASLRLPFSLSSFTTTTKSSHSVIDPPPPPPAAAATGSAVSTTKGRRGGERKKTKGSTSSSTQEAPSPPKEKTPQEVEKEVRKGELHTKGVPCVMAPLRRPAMAMERWRLHLLPPPSPRSPGMALATCPASSECLPTRPRRRLWKTQGKQMGDEGMERIPPLVEASHHESVKEQKQQEKNKHASLKASGRSEKQSSSSPLSPRFSFSVDKTTTRKTEERRLLSLSPAHEPDSFSIPLLEELHISNPFLLPSDTSRSFSSFSSSSTVRGALPETVVMEKRPHQEQCTEGDERSRGEDGLVYSTGMLSSSFKGQSWTLIMGLVVPVVDTAGGVSHLPPLPVFSSSTVTTLLRTWEGARRRRRQEAHRRKQLQRAKQEKRESLRKGWDEDEEDEEEEEEEEEEERRRVLFLLRSLPKAVREDPIRRICGLPSSFSSSSSSFLFPQGSPMLVLPSSLLWPAVREFSRWYFGKDVMAIASDLVQQAHLLPPPTSPESTKKNTSRIEGKDGTGFRAGASTRSIPGRSHRLFSHYVCHPEGYLRYRVKCVVREYVAVELVVDLQPLLQWTSFWKKMAALRRVEVEKETATPENQRIKRRRNQKEEELQKNEKGKKSPAKRKNVRLLLLPGRRSPVEVEDGLRPSPFPLLSRDCSLTDDGEKHSKLLTAKEEKGSRSGGGFASSSSQPGSSSSSFLSSPFSPLFLPLPHPFFEENPEPEWWRRGSLVFPFRSCTCRPRAHERVKISEVEGGKQCRHMAAVWWLFLHQQVQLVGST